MIFNNLELEKKVLKIGFVKLIDWMPKDVPSGMEKLGCDYAIAQAARVSYGDGSKGFENDKRLIRYLFRNKHTSPFEMVRFKFHLKLPIFVQRQLIRHRTANVNEISGRYTQINDEFYIPDELRGQSDVNKQGSNNELVVTDELVETFKDYLLKNQEVYGLYDSLIKQGVAKEIARIALPQNIYTELYWCIDLHNLFNFLKLRSSPHAQQEIREYANAIHEIVKLLCPVSIAAFEEYTIGSVTFSSKEMKLIKRYLSNKSVDISGVFYTKREEQEFKDKIVLMD